jgi:hypothetical protein
VVDTPLGYTWTHAALGDAANAREQFAKADAKAYQAYAGILARVPAPNLIPLPPSGPRSYDFQGQAYDYGTYGSGYTNFSGTVTPRKSTNFVDAYNQGRQTALIMQRNEIAMAPVYAAQARAKQAYLDSMAAQGWKLVPEG